MDIYLYISFNLQDLKEKNDIKIEVKKRIF